MHCYAIESEQATMKPDEKNKVIYSIRSAWEAAQFAKPSGATPGAGRVYVMMPGDAKLASVILKACKALGLTFQRKSYYGGTNAIYVGYENFSGATIAKGDAFARELRAAGLDAYYDVHCD